MEIKTEWVKCPICGNKTRDKMREDTVVKKFPLFCPKCKKESLIEIEDLVVKVIQEPDAQTQSQLSMIDSLLCFLLVKEVNVK